MKRDQKNMTKLLVGVIVALVAVLAVLVVVLVLTPSATITSHSAQAEVEAEQKALKEAEKEGYYDTDVIEVVDLSALIGLDLASALTEIGHGAEIDGDPKLVAGGLKEVTVLLGEESASIDTGMALTHLYLDKAGVVVSASYRININDLTLSSVCLKARGLRASCQTRWSLLRKRSMRTTIQRGRPSMKSASNSSVRAPTKRAMPSIGACYSITTTLRRSKRTTSRRPFAPLRWRSAPLRKKLLFALLPSCAMMHKL